MKKGNIKGLLGYIIAVKGLLSYVIIIIIVVLIKSFVVTPIRVNGDSMNETLYDKEIMLLNKYIYNFEDVERFDIVVVKYEKSKLIKRVIGLPGETIEYKDSKLYIDGEVIEEPYIKEETLDFVTKEIPQNCYFIMGDNRDDSLDSRYFGCVNKKDVLGYTNFIMFPFTKIGKVQ